MLGCAMLALAGMSGLLAWLGTLPARDQLLHQTGQLQELRLRDANTGAFTITLLSSGTLQTFDFDNADRLVGQKCGQHAPWLIRLPQANCRAKSLLQGRWVLSRASALRSVESRKCSS